MLLSTKLTIGAGGERGDRRTRRAADAAVAVRETEVAPVHGGAPAVFQMGFPCHALDFHGVNLIFFFVEERVNPFGAPEGNVVFGRVASGHNRDNLFHCFCYMLEWLL